MDSTTEIMTSETTSDSTTTVSDSPISVDSTTEITTFSILLQIKKIQRKFPNFLAKFLLKFVRKLS